MTLREALSRYRVLRERARRLEQPRAAVWLCWYGLWGPLA